MRTRLSAAIAATCVALLAGGCATTSFKASTVDGAVKASNAFGFDFYRQAREGQDNFVCSPAGAAIAPTMVAAGARGETQAEMLHTLHIDSTNLDQTYGSFAAILAALKSRDGEDDLVMNVADRVWVQKDLKLLPDYVSLLRDGFRSPLAEVDFKTNNEAALLAINQWASDETHGHIPQILAGLKDAVRMVLVNAVYMMGAWQQPFEENPTYNSKFATLNKETMVRMMKQVSTFRFAEVRGAKLIELPYRGGLSMIVVLPSDVDGLAKVEDRLSGSYPDWIGALKHREVDLELPRFTVTTELPLIPMLTAMGIRRAFDPDRADFSGMAGPEVTLFVGNAIQKAWIETNEMGTEAAAVTAVEVHEVLLHAIDKPPPPPPVIFHADHPFLYLIRDVKSGAILFVGRVVKPAQ
jgi:serpin B